MTEPTSPSRASDGIGALRALITVLVVAHHAALPYHPFAPPPFDSLRRAPFWQAFPVVDPDRWSGALWFTWFNDTFFMSLMFLISGLFVWRSLTAKGGARYLRDRARRLGLPFLVGAALLAPLAYAPAYLQTGAPASWSGFWREWLALATWPAGPAWFLWVLLAFNLVAVALAAVMPRWAEHVARGFGDPARRPAIAFAVLVAASAAAYLPLVLEFGGLAWSARGPFAIQTSRALHYAVYFAAGVALGAGGLERGLVAGAGRLAARWPRWLVAGLAGFGLAVVATMGNLGARGAGAWPVLDALGFVIACAALCFACLAGFARLAPGRSRALASLRRHAFGIYVVHYVFVSWLAYALVPVALPAAAKAAVVLGGALAASWAVAAALHRLVRARPAAPVLGALAPPRG